jgi:hypothetical protein
MGAGAGGAQAVFAATETPFAEEAEAVMGPPLIEDDGVVQVEQHFGQF